MGKWQQAGSGGGEECGNGGEGGGGEEQGWVVWGVWGITGKPKEATGELQTILSQYRMGKYNMAGKGEGEEGWQRHGGKGGVGVNGCQPAQQKAPPTKNQARSRLSSPAQTSCTNQTVSNHSPRNQTTIIIHNKYKWA